MGSHRSFIVPTLLSVLALGACHTSHDANTSTASSPATGLPRFVDPTTGATLAEAELTVDCGRVAISQSVACSAFVRNDGTAAFTVLDIVPSADGSPAFSFAPIAFTVAAGAQAELTLRFTPTDEGTVSTSLVLSLDNGDPASLTVRASGTGFSGYSPLLAAGPTQLLFEAPSDAAQVRRLTLASVGIPRSGSDDENLRFGIRAEDGSWVEKRPEITGPDAAAFSVDWPPAGYTSAGLAPNHSVELKVRLSSAGHPSISATLTIFSNDPVQARVDVALTSALPGDTPTCEFEVRPPALNFGSVELPKSQVLSFAIVNIDENPQHVCRYSEVRLSPTTEQASNFSLVNGPIAGGVLRGGESLLVPVRFAPRADGLYSGEVRISMSNSDRREVSVPLAGIVESACAMVAPRELDFGTIGIRCASRARVFTIYNTCTRAISVTSVELRGDSGFSFARMPSLPTTIPSGGSTEFSVGYRPLDFGDDAAAVLISVERKPDAYVVPVQGRGAQDPLQTDVFSQPEIPKVDVLFVIDNSETMADKQTALTRNLDSMATYMLQQGVDVHIAVTTTDVSASGAAGRFLPLAGNNPRVITSSTPNAIEALKQNLHVGISGSESEALLQPAFLALSSPLLTGHNSGFYRDEAKLAVIVISDAADHDPAMQPTSFYSEFLVGLKGVRRRNDVTLSGIVPTHATAPAGCSYDSANAGADARVRSVVTGTGGLLDEICNPDWFQTLEKLGTRTFAQRDHFFLSNVPDMSVTPDPIVITIDGARYDQYDAHGVKRWDYLSASNEVAFDPLYKPAPGQTIAISYYVACLH